MWVTMPGVQNLEIARWYDSGYPAPQMAAKTEPPYWIDELHISKVLQSVGFPTRILFGQWNRGQITAFYEGGLSAAYDLKTGVKIRDNFPTRLRMSRVADNQKLLEIEGGRGTLYIESSTDMVHWEPLLQVSDYTGYTEVELFGGMGSFFRAYTTE
jgi:hypothetical protein